MDFTSYNKSRFIDPKRLLSITENTKVRPFISKYPDGGNISPKAFTLRYITSPEYKRKLERSGYPNPNAEIVKRYDAVKGTTVVEHEDTPGIFERISNVLTGEQGVENGSHARNLNRVDISIPEAKKFNTNKNDITTHEFSHKETGTLHGQNLNDHDKELLNAGMNNNASKHDRLSGESKADMNALRYDLYNKGVDVFNRKVTHQDLQKLDGYESHSNDRLFKNYDEGELLWLMNNIAQSKDTNPQIPQAALGGEMKPLTDTTGYANRSKKFIFDAAHHGEDGFTGIKRDQDKGYTNEAIQRAANVAPYGTAPIDWGVRRSGENFEMYPMNVQKPYTEGLTRMLPDEAYKYAQKTNSVMNVGSDPNFAKYLATVGVHENLKITNPQAWQGVMDRYVRSTNIKPSNDMVKYAPGGGVGDPPGVSTNSITGVDASEWNPFMETPSDMFPDLEQRMQPMTITTLDAYGSKGRTLPNNGELKTQTPEKKQPSWIQQNGQKVANATIGVIGALGQQRNDSNLEQSYNDMMQFNGNTDVAYDMYPTNQNPYGDYMVNRGQGQNFQPNKMEIAQNAGNNFSYEMGGEYEMSDTELKQFLEAGGEVDYL